VKQSLEDGDAGALRRILEKDPAQANILIRWGTNERNHTHPLHYVSDLLFERKLQKGRELPLIDALLKAGAQLDFQRNGKGDTPLIGAASLGAEEVGLRLLKAGANPALRGLFGETALHWAALLGEAKLAKKLIPGSDLNLLDEKYQSPPLGWAMHGWSNPPAGNHGRHLEVVRLLVAAGAMVKPEWSESENVRANPAMRAALRSRSRLPRS